MPGVLLTATLSTGGTVVVDDTIAVAAIAALTEAMSEFTALAANIPGTPASNLATIAEATNDMANMMTDVITQQQEINRNIELLVRSMTRVSTNIGTGVTTAQLAYLDQSKANLFQQTQSQDALARAGLPPTTVTPGDISQRVTGTAKDIGDLQLQSKVAGLTQDGLAYVGDLVTDVGTNLIEEALDATGISGLWNTAKQKFNALFPKITTARKKAVQTNAVKRGATSGRPTIQVPIDIDQG
jgi:hypothetical protein